MFAKEKRSTSAKIGVISTAWTMLLIAMMATTFGLYAQKPQPQEQPFQQLTSRYQYMNYY